MNSRLSNYESDQESDCSLANNFFLINSNLERLLEHHFMGLLSKFWV